MHDSERRNRLLNRARQAVSEDRGSAGAAAEEIADAYPPSCAPDDIQDTPTGTLHVLNIIAGTLAGSVRDEVRCFDFRANAPAVDRVAAAWRFVIATLVTSDPDLDTLRMPGLAHLGTLPWQFPASKVHHGRAFINWACDSWAGQHEPSPHTLNGLDEALSLIDYCSEQSRRFQIWWDSEGHLNLTGAVPLSALLGSLHEQLLLFLARLESCDRGDDGSYLFRSQSTGGLGGFEVIWDRIQGLAATSMGRTLPLPTPEEQDEFKKTGASVRLTGPVRNLKPIADIASCIFGLTPRDATRNWPPALSAADANRIRAVAAEIPLHREMWARSEAQGVTTTRNPTFSQTPTTTQSKHVGLGTFRVKPTAQALPQKQAPAATSAPSIYLTQDHKSILNHLVSEPTLCQPVVKIASIGPIRNRETVGKLLKELAGYGLVHRPHGIKKGYCLTPSGVERAKLRNSRD